MRVRARGAVGGVGLAMGLALMAACVPRDGAIAPERDRAEPARSGVERAARRAYDGAPPVIPHEEFGADCMSCHTLEGLEVPELGFAPPMPHERTRGLSRISRCRQCHVPRRTDAVFVANRFEGLRQDLRHGRRLNPLAPPRMPHPVFLRENCLACHDGPAARPEIRTPHPERTRCRQCHVPITTPETFSRGRRRAR